MSEESQYSEHPGGWIEWFCNLPQNSFLCEVDEDYIKDPKNFELFYQKFPQFNAALAMILSTESPDSLDLENEKFIEVYQEASDIYGLLHSHFITTPIGLAIMRERFLNGRFGHCPRVLCEKQNVIPIGMCEQLRTSRVKAYCPRCKEAYAPRRSLADFDGAYIGRSFPQLLLLTYPDIHPQYTIRMGTPLFVPFEATLFGFKVCDGQILKQKQQEQLEIKSDIKSQEQKEEKSSLESKQITDEQKQQQQQQQQQDKENAQQPSKKSNKNKNRRKNKNK